MAVIKSNIEAILATEEEVQSYYELVAYKMNLLFEKYDIRNAEGIFETISTDKIKARLTVTGIFEATPLQSIFFDRKQQFVPAEIIYTFRNIISEPPLSIKANFFETFLTLLARKGWDKSIITYLREQYNLPLDEYIILDDLKDFSLGTGVYRATFQLRAPRRLKVTVFLKKSTDADSCNELLYSYLQKELLVTAHYAKMPHRLLGKNNTEELLLTPLVEGVVSDTFISILTQAYIKAEQNDQKANLKKALEIMIEVFISHAVLGDLLGRNDRHLMNSLFAPIMDGILQKNTQDDLANPEKLLAWVENIILYRTKAISLIDIDLKWLLEEENSLWALIDIDFGLSEINLLSLLPEFNNYDAKNKLFFQNRKEYITYYFNIYCQTLENILKQKELIFSAIKKSYPPDSIDKKSKFFAQRVYFFQNSKESIVEIFKRYLLNFRMRFIHKATLIELDCLARETNNKILLSALNQTDLLKYLPPNLAFETDKHSVFFQLQCFRGVMSEKDMLILSEKNRTTWESVASNIATVAEKFNNDLFKTLDDKKQFIQEDTAALLNSLSF